MMSLEEVDIGKAERCLKAYVLEFIYAEKGDSWYKYASQEQRELLENVSMDDLTKLLQSLKLYGGPQGEAGWRFFCERTVYDVNGAKPRKRDNRRVLGCDGSYFRGDAPQMGHLEPRFRPAWCMDTLIKRPDRDPVHATVLTVTAPALDNDKQADARVFKHSNGSLNEPRYASAMNTIAQQILECSNDHPELGDVGISAAGMGAFLEGLKPSDQRTAMQCGVMAYADLAGELMRRGKKPVFLGKKDDPFWKLVNVELKKREKSSVMYLGLVPACITKKVAQRTLFVSSGDFSALGGNACYADRKTVEGAFGMSSLLHFQHALASIVFNNRVRGQQSLPAKKKRWSLPIL